IMFLLYYPYLQYTTRLILASLRLKSLFDSLHLTLTSVALPRTWRMMLPSESAVVTLSRLRSIPIAPAGSISAISFERLMLRPFVVSVRDLGLRPPIVRNVWSFRTMKVYSPLLTGSLTRRWMTRNP